MKKKLLSALLSASLVATALVGCGGSAEAPAETATAETKEEAPAETAETPADSHAFSQ